MSRAKNERKTVEVARKRVPLRKLLHGKEIRAAAKALEDFRLNLNEAEFMYGAKITLTMDSYGECVAVAKRPETDQEYTDRLERQRIADELKKEREAKKKLQAEQRKVEEEIRKKARIAEHIRELAKTNGLSQKEVLDILNQ